MVTPTQTAQAETMTTKTERWQKAQSYEEAWWQDIRDSIELDYLQDYAAELADNLSGILTIRSDTKILEIGSGPAGILTFLKSDHRFAIDPLESFFATVEKFAAYRDPQVNYFDGRSEELPFEDGMFDLIIIDNVLDHCEDIPAVFAEMRRVAKQGAVVYLRLNVYHVWGKIVRRLAELFQIDEGHPHTFSKADLERYFRQYDFEILKKKNRGFLKTWTKHLLSLQLKGLIKAASFSSPDTVTYVVRKRNC